MTGAVAQLAEHQIPGTSLARFVFCLVDVLKVVAVFGNLANHNLEE